MVLKSVVRPLVVVGGLLALLASSQAGLSSGLGGRGTRPPASYTVRGGDTLSAIAARFGVTVDRLASANNIGNIHRVYAGSKLSIPTGATAASNDVGGGATGSGRGASTATGRYPALLLARPERLALVPLFDKWARTYNVPADLLKALAWMESGWQNTVTSSVKAYGIGQLTPATVDFVSGQLLGQHLDPKVPSDNIQMAARYIRYLLDQTGGDVRSTLAGYFQGLGSVHRGGILPISKWYADTIIALRPLFT